MMVNFIYFFNLITNLFYNPFLFEFIFFFLSIFYIFFCAIVAQTTNNFSLIFPFSGFVKKLISFLIVFSLFGFFFSPITISSTFFNGYLMENNALTFFKIFFLCLWLLIFSHFFDFVYRFWDYWNDFKLYPLFLFGSFFFLLLLFSTYNLILTILCILGMSICFYVAILGHMGFGKLSRETVVKYFLFSALSTGFLLGGAKEIYLACGTLQFDLISNNFLVLVIENLQNWHSLFLIKIALILIICGFFFKLSAFPSHFWAPEVYDGMPFALISFIVIITKFSISFIFLKIIKFIFVLPVASRVLNFFFLNEMDLILTCVIFFSIIFGGILALREKRIKRFIAYSSINQIGFLLIGLLGCNATLFSIQVFLYFLFVYIFNLTILLALINWYAYKLNILINTDNVKLQDNKFDLNYISDFKNMYFYFQVFNKIYPKFYLVSVLFWISFILVIFSLAGIPPLLGFYSKFYVLVYAFYYKYWFVFGIGIIMSIVGAYYYLRILKVIFFEKFEKTEFETSLISHIEAIIKKDEKVLGEDAEEAEETYGGFLYAILLENVYTFNKFRFFYLFIIFFFICDFFLIFACFLDPYFMQFLYILSQYIILY